MKNIMYYNQALSKNNKFNIKISKRMFYFYPWINNLTKFYRNHQELSKRVKSMPKLLTKLNRPYINISLKIKEKLSLIISSYKFIDDNLVKEAKEILYRTGQLKISEIIGKNEEKFELFLLLYHACDKEGELQLVLTNSDNIRISKLTFSMLEDKKNWSLFIGGIQGTSSKVNFEKIKEASKTLYGLRTQRIMLEALYQFENFIGVKTNKYGVGKTQHIFNDRRYKGKHGIPLGYDEFWESIGGKRNEMEIFWSLPKYIVKKNIDEIASKKRSQYRKRYDLLEQIALNMKLDYSNEKKEIKFL